MNGTTFKDYVLAHDHFARLWATQVRKRAAEGDVFALPTAHQAERFALTARATGQRPPQASFIVVRPVGSAREVVPEPFAIVFSRGTDRESVPASASSSSSSSSSGRGDDEVDGSIRTPGAAAETATVLPAEAVRADSLNDILQAVETRLRVPFAFWRLCRGRSCLDPACDSIASLRTDSESALTETDMVNLMDACVLEGCEPSSEITKGVVLDSNGVELSPGSPREPATHGDVESVLAGLDPSLAARTWDLVPYLEGELHSYLDGKMLKRTAADFVDPSRRARSASRGPSADGAVMAAEASAAAAGLLQGVQQLSLASSSSKAADVSVKAAPAAAALPLSAEQRQRAAANARFAETKRIHQRLASSSRMGRYVTAHSQLALDACSRASAAWADRVHLLRLDANYLEVDEPTSFVVHSRVYSAGGADKGVEMVSQYLRQTTYDAVLFRLCLHVRTTFSSAGSAPAGSSAERLPDARLGEAPNRESNEPWREVFLLDLDRHGNEATRFSWSIEELRNLADILGWTTPLPALADFLLASVGICAARHHYAKKLMRAAPEMEIDLGPSDPRGFTWIEKGMFRLLAT